MFRTDTGNFNRFLTSLGLLLLLGALIVPYFYFHDTDTLRIPASELKELTPVAREALETRQHRNQDLEVWILGLSGALAIGGIALLWLGGRRLRTAQQKEDAAIDRKAKRDDVEIQRMSQSEVDEKREEQARESVQEETESQPEESPPPEEDKPLPPPNATASTATLRSSRLAIERIETTVRGTLEGSEFHSYKFLYEVKTVTRSPSKRQEVRLDGLFRSQERKRPDVILELKVIRQSRSIRLRLRTLADSVIALVARYGRISRRDPLGWLVIVMPSEVEPMDLEERRRLQDQANDALIGMAKATIVHESELSTLAERFTQLFEVQAK